jgi:hypothetical protein
VLVLAGMVTSYIWLDGHQSLKKRIEVYNADASDTAVLIDAVRVLRRGHGQVGFFANAAEGVHFAYIPTHRQAAFHPSDEGNQSDQEIAFMKREKCGI